MDRILENVREKIWRMTQDFGGLEQKLEKIYKDMKNKIFSLKESNLDYLKSVELGLKTKIKEVTWMEYFLQYQLEEANSVDFIHNFFTHQKIQIEFSQNFKICKPKLELVSFLYTLCNIYTYYKFFHTL